MRIINIFTIVSVLLLPSQVTLAADVTLPVNVLEWSFYILLIFAVSVAIGIFFFSKGKNGKSVPLSKLLYEHNPPIHSVCPEVSVTDCVSQMNAHRVGAMLVMDGDQLLGIFTERDAITKVLGAGLIPSSTEISEVMTKNPICVTTKTTLGEAMGIVTNQRIRHLPVVEDGKVLGMVSSGDLTHRLVEDQTGEIRDLVDLAGRWRRFR